ncbi:uncharacterized protein LOC133324427 [Musca vetustissima]|uniref:uncharacterized protein LOC133324427 n=1 Tax=Musca vetustissima TaxID=27455 RepID=UPI002AB790BE|nr:uncharacterized protein LOC133324427 [Musca vetustissima]
MYGYPIRLGINKDGTKAYVVGELGNSYILSGHVGAFFTVFSRIHNASIDLPHYNKTAETTLVLLTQLVENGTYDMSLELAINMYVNDMVYSNTYDFLDWCLMVPMEKPIPAYLFYINIFDGFLIAVIFCSAFCVAFCVALTYWLRGDAVCWLDVIFNIYIYNGILGHPFHMEKKFAGVRSFLYLLIGMSGLIINTTFVTHLQTFKTHPPTEKPITTLDDFRNSKLKIAIYTEEFMLLQKYNATSAYEEYAHLVPSYRDYHRLRDSYDNRFAYPVPSAQWSQYEQQQQFFSKPKYRLSDICFVRKIGVMIPMQSNSPYEDAINKLIGIVNQAGLIQYWKTLEFLEALQRNRMNLIDVSAVNTYEVLKMEDIKLLGYLIGVVEEGVHN